MPKKGKQHSNSRSKSSNKTNAVSQRREFPAKHSKSKHNSKPQKKDNFQKTKPIHK